MQLQLFRAIANGNLKAWEVGVKFAYAGTNIDANSHAVVEQVFVPMARDLMRQINRTLEQARDEALSRSSAVPGDEAADTSSPRRRASPNRNFTNFRAVYDDLTGEVERSSEQFLTDHLENWFSLIDETPGVREFVKQLENSSSYLLWRIELKRPLNLPQAGDPQGTNYLMWPQGRDKRLGTQLSLFREISRRHEDAGEIGAKHLLGSSNSTGAKDLVAQVFSPMARDLRRRLEDELVDRPEQSVPASDRIVRLDHNSAAYAEAIEALARLEYALTTTNEYEDTEERDQLVAEVSAGKRLLQAVRARVSAVAEVLGKGLRYLAKKFVDSGIGKAAGFAWEAIMRLLGS
jgi:hypothetical protein